MVGAIIFFYPIVSNWLSVKEHHTVISEHNQALKRMTEDEKKTEQMKAQTHNESLNQSSIPITDPFSDTAEEETSTSYYDVLNIGEAMGSLEIPSINATMPIYHGVSEDVLQKGIGHMSNSSFPIGGLGSHTALTGHRGLPSSKLFRDLDKVKEEDLFFIRTLGETLAYKVDEIQIVLPSETGWLEMHEDKDYVTLITCEPYMINTHRLLVRGERVPYQKTEIVKEEELSKSSNYSIYLWIIGILVIIVVLFIYFQRKLKMEV